MSFLVDKVVMEGITFDDVLLLPSYSKVLPRKVNINTRFTKDITLNTPIVSAAMDTVTEAELAIAIAREGGIGVIHKNMSIEKQAIQVRKVKRAENVMILEPVSIGIDSTVSEALDLMKEYRIGGIPVIKDDNVLVGIVTNRDLRFEHEMTKKISEIMTKDLITTDQETDLDKAAQILQKHKIEKLPIVNNKNQLVGLITYKDITKTKDRPSSCKDKKGRLRVAAAIGIAPDTLDRAEALIKSDVDALSIDTAHAHTKNVVLILKEIKRNFPDTQIVAGNIGTAEAAIMLADEGADAVKVGIG
ncbi:MAG TPA: IMP dehydrogenase, partial [Bacteroidales bacterium]|nr:IMP dehydrogenase [Bacteroidales bacterium]